MKKFNNVLLVNDDGYDSEGILLLKELLLPYCNRIVILGPKVHQSGKSSAITLGKGLTLTKVSDDYYHIDGTPVDCAAFGLTSLDIDFDLLVSGCNNGENLTYDTLYSGTIGAALEALKHNIKAIAFSTPIGNFKLVKNYFSIVMDYIIENNLISAEYLANVNFPKGDVVNDIMITKLSRRDEKTFYIYNKDENKYYASRSINETKQFSDEDFYCFNHSIVSITPLAKSLFDNDYFTIINKK